MQELLIESDREFAIRFHAKTLATDGWPDSYIVELSARHFMASFEVGNAREGSSPCVLFEEMAAEPDGWPGLKSWGALEGEFGLSASMDPTGHVTLTVERDASWQTPGWSCSFSLLIEAGQLAGLAADARDFFSRQQRPPAAL